MPPATFQDTGDYRENTSDTLQPNLLAAGISGLIIGYAAVILRFVARRRSNTLYAADDWLILVALFPLTGSAIGVFLMVSKGIGRHFAFITNIHGLISSYIAAIVCLALCNALIKFSILCFYRRIFPTRSLIFLSWAIAIVVAAYNLVFILLAGLECGLSTAVREVEPCIQSQHTAHKAIAIINTVTDVVILAVPICLVWSLQMKRSRKVQASSIFLLGGIICFFSVARAVSTGRAPQTDHSFAQAYPAIWTFAEISVGIVAACLPTLSPLLDKKRIRMITSTAKRFLTGKHSSSNE